jgi:starch-binding outer membrane protein, SusD/RagB family
MKIASRHPLLFGTAFMVLTAATLYGCKDFLDKAAAPQGTLNEQSLAVKPGIEASLIATYRALDWNNGVGGNWGNTASNWVWGSVTSDDAYKGSEATDQPNINDIEAYQWNTGRAETYLNERWRGVYEGVVRANATLRALNTLRAQAGAIPVDTANQIEGEAKFLRAHFHFEAWRMWVAIPYYKETDTDIRKANDDSATVLTNILADLDDAIAKLPPTPRNGEKARVTSWTAQAYKGRVQMHAGQFAAALTTLRAVRASNVYALETSFDRVWTGFAAFENGKETILAYQAVANDGEPNGNNSNYGERLNLPHGDSHSSCCGFHQPSQNLVNFYKVDAVTGLPLALTDPNWNASNTNFVAGSAQAVDPRLDWTVGRDNVPYKDWGLHKASWIRQVSYGGFYSPKKNAHELAANAESKVGWVPTQLNAVNIHIFRYADMLLLLAEAEVEAPGGVLGNALTIVNEIRTRAGQRAQGPATSAATIAVPINDPSITWATYRVGTYPAFGSQAEARAAVRNERRLELAMEGIRFFDLKRWGIAHTVINSYLDLVGGGSEATRRTQLSGASRWSGPTDCHYRFPIPQIQIELSKVGTTSRLTQNPIC